MEILSYSTDMNIWRLWMRMATVTNGRRDRLVNFFVLHTTIFMEAKDIETLYGIRNKIKIYKGKDVSMVCLLLIYCFWWNIQKITGTEATRIIDKSQIQFVFHGVSVFLWKWQQ